MTLILINTLRCETSFPWQPCIASSHKFHTYEHGLSLKVKMGLLEFRSSYSLRNILVKLFLEAIEKMEQNKSIGGEQEKLFSGSRIHHQSQNEHFD